VSRNEVVVAYVGLGSNLADPVAQVRAAMSALATLPQTRAIRCSSLYRSAPIGKVRDQPDFINAACRVETTASAPDILRALLAIEKAAGRVRDGQKGGPRILDLDLLLFGAEIHQASDLVLPHPRLHERAFVLYPLVELDPGLSIPGKGSVSVLLARCDGQSVEPLPAVQVAVK